MGRINVTSPIFADSNVQHFDHETFDWACVCACECVIEGVCVCLCGNACLFMVAEEVVMVGVRVCERMRMCLSLPFPTPDELLSGGEAIVSSGS